jgi:rhodanese-related sulfurtransferase
MSKASEKREKRAQARGQTRRIGSMVAGIVVVAVIAILLLVFLPAGGGDKEITVFEAADKIDQGAFVLDVRTQEEWAEYHITGATLIPLDELEARVDEVPRDQEVVVVCRSGNRSQQGRNILLDAGFTEVSSMKGGLIEWQTQGYPVVAGP